MSQQPPPPPYGGPPGYPPYPPGMPGMPGPQGQPGMSNKAKFWIGVALAIPALLVSGVVTGFGSAVVGGLGGSSEAKGIVTVVTGLVVVALFVAALVWERTRWFALGIMAGTAVLLILAAGACIVLIVALSNSLS